MLAEEGLLPLQLQKQRMADLCLHAAKPDAFSSFILPPVTFHFFYIKAWQLWLSTVSGCSRTGKAVTCCGCGQAGGRAGGESAAPGSKTSWPGDTDQPVPWEKGWWFSGKTSLAAKCPVHYRDRGFLWEPVIMLLLNYQMNCRNSKLITILQVRLLVGDKENQP